MAATPLTSQKEWFVITCLSMGTVAAWPWSASGSVGRGRRRCSGGVTVISPDGQVLEEIFMDEHVTNCIFAGSTLYVTATKVSEIHADQRTGSFWRVETDATGLPLIQGKL